MKTYTIETEAGPVDAFPMIPAFVAPKLPATFTANRKALVNRIKTVAGFVPSRTPRAILTNLRMSVNGTVELSATDCERWIETAEDHDRSGDRVDLVPAKQLLSALRSLKSKDVTCEFEGNRLTLRGDGGALTIPLNDDVDDYPAVPHVEAVVIVTMEGAKLADAIDGTIFATDCESTRYALGGIMFDLVYNPAEPTPQDGTLTLAATDTRRLAIRECGSVGIVGCTGNLNDTIVVPTAFLSAIRGMVAGESCLTIKISENEIELIGTNWRAISRLVQGRFPRYRDVIPCEANRQVCFHAADLLAGIESAAMATTDEQSGIDLKFGNAAGETIVTMRGKSCDKGESTAVVKGAQVILTAEKRRDRDGKNIHKNDRQRHDVITIRPEYLAEFLRELPKTAKYVQLSLTNCESAMVVTATGIDGKYIVMPLGRGK